MRLTVSFQVGQVEYLGILSQYAARRASRLLKLTSPLKLMPIASENSPIPYAVKISTISASTYI
jgi:hypothetical protein